MTEKITLGVERNIKDLSLYIAQLPISDEQKTYLVREIAYAVSASITELSNAFFNLSTQYKKPLNDLNGTYNYKKD